MELTLFIAPEHLLENLPAMERLRATFSRIIVAGERRRAIAELVGAGPVVDAVIVGFLDAIRAEDVTALTRLRVVGSTATGTDHLPMDALRARGVRVVTADGANAYAVGEHALMMVLALLKRAAEGHEAVVSARDRAGVRQWPRDLRGRRVGLIGGGRTALALLRLLRAFDCEVRVWTRHPDRHPELAALGAGTCGMDEVFECCEVVSLHVPLAIDTRGMVTGAHLRRLPKDAILINVARREIVDWASVAPVLAERRDLMLGADGLRLGDLGIPGLMEGRCILSPHVAGVTEGALRAMQDRVVAGVVEVFAVGRDG